MNTTLFFVSGSLLYLLAYSLGRRDGHAVGIEHGRRDMYEQIAREVDEANARIRHAVAQAQIAQDAQAEENWIPEEITEIDEKKI